MMESDSPPPSSDDNIVQLTETEGNNQLALFIDIEEKRIDSLNKKTEVVEKLIKAQDDSDKRQFEYSMNVLEEKKKNDIRIFAFVRNVVYVGGGVFVVVFAFLFYVAFFGGATEKELAQNFLVYLFSAIAGYGIFSPLVNAIRKTLNRD